MPIFVEKNIEMTKTKVKYTEGLKQIPDKISDSEVIYLLHSGNIDRSYISLFKKYSSLTDDIISNWLNISVRTLRNYKNSETILKENTKEQLLLLISLYKQGNEVFGSSKEFNKWINTKNFYFDDVAPVSFLNTVTGIRFIKNRLTAMEYGDNV